jgi:hypothetical protein
MTPICQRTDIGGVDHQAWNIPYLSIAFSRPKSLFPINLVVAKQSIRMWAERPWNLLTNTSLWPEDTTDRCRALLGCSARYALRVRAATSSVTPGLPRRPRSRRNAKARAGERGRRKERSPHANGTTYRQKGRCKTRETRGAVEARQYCTDDGCANEKKTLKGVKCP